MAKLAPLVPLVALLSSNPAAAADASPRQPTGAWVVDFAAAQCVASRNYGTEADPLVLALKAPPIGDVMQLAVIRPGSDGRTAEHLDAKILIDGGVPIDTSMVAFAVPGSEQRLFRTNLPLEQFEAVSNAKTISIQAEGQLDQGFELNQMEPLLRIMRNCTADLRRVWNVDEGARLKQRAVGDMASLFGGDFFAALNLDQMPAGTARVALLVDEQGRIADCTVIETSGVAALDAQSCGMMKARAHYSPAIGLDGRPAKDARTQSIIWETE